MDNTQMPQKTPLRDAPWQAKAEMSLMILAKKGETITYDALARLAEVPAPHRIHKLTLFLEQLIAEDIAAKAPIKAALVISKVRGIPAPGFFDTLTACGANLPDADDHNLHQTLLKALNPAF